MFVLRYVTTGREICRRETLEEIGEESLWYSNRGYECRVEEERLIDPKQTTLSDNMENLT